MSDGNPFEENNKYAEVERQTGGLSVRNRNIIPNLKAQRQELQMRLDKIDNLLNLLNANPEMVKIIDLSRELL